MMVWIVVKCPLCQSTDVVKNGKSKQGKQRYRCHNEECLRSSFILDYTNHGYRPDKFNYFNIFATLTCNLNAQQITNYCYFK